MTERYKKKVSPYDIVAVHRQREKLKKRRPVITVTEPQSAYDLAAIGKMLEAFRLAKAYGWQVEVKRDPLTPPIPRSNRTPSIFCEPKEQK